MAVRDVDQSHSAAGSTAAWLGDYANDVWNKPQEHLIEIGIAGAAVAAAVSPVARVGLRALSERGAVTALPEAAKAGATVTGESIMSASAVKTAVERVRNLSYEIDSGFSTFVGKIGPTGERVLTTENRNAFRLRPLTGSSTDAIYAHELVLPKGADKFTARFLIDSQHTHSWSSLSKPAWPNGKSGVWANLDDAGINVRPTANTPMKLEFTSEMSHLEIASISGKRINVGLDTVLEGKINAAGRGAVSNQIGSIRIDGPSAVQRGNGLIQVRNPEWKIERSRAFDYPEIQAGGTLRIYHDPLATISPALTPDVRYMTKQGLARQI
jgi:hypothetical protein